jgi:hypothetical protein
MRTMSADGRERHLLRDSTDWRRVGLMMAGPVAFYSPLVSVYRKSMAKILEDGRAWKKECSGCFCGIRLHHQRRNRPP